MLLAIVNNNAGGEVSGGESLLQTPEFYSGIECLERAAGLLDRPVDIIGLLADRCQSLANDSSRQLASLAMRQKLNATVFDAMNDEQIVRCPYPMLMHVMGGRYSSKPDYYILCTGVRDGVAKLYSPSAGEVSIPLNWLEADRRGEAIVLSREPLAADAVFMRRSAPIVSYGMMFAAVLGLAGFAYGRRGKTRPITLGLPQAAGSGTQLGLIFSMSVMLTFVCQCVAGRSIVPVAPHVEPVDFLVSSRSSASASAIKPPEIGLEAAMRLNFTDAVFVDARDSGDYNAGHIRGAILCPADDIARWHVHMAGIDLRRRLIVYCAEASCGKGEYVATFLLKNGFTDVSLYRDGWAKWTGSKEAR